MATVKEVAEKFGFVNVDDAIKAATVIGVPLHVAFALIQMESWGKNIFGSDKGGMFKGLPVTEARFREMTAAVKKGHVSNGVGPLQITYKGFFPDAEKNHLQLWLPYDNYLYGFKLLNDLYKSTASWQRAGTRYNGSKIYGVTFALRISQWKKRLSGATVTPPPRKTIEEIAQEVIDGKWGDGALRIRDLTKAGYSAKDVQIKVNQILSNK